MTPPSTHPQRQKADIAFVDFFSFQESNKDLLLKTLTTSPVFEGLSAAELKMVSHMLHLRLYQQDEIIFHQDEKGLGLYIVASGRVGVSRQAPEIHSSPKSEVVLEEGGLLGEMTLIHDSHLRPATAVALSRSILIGFFRPDLSDLVERKPEIGSKVLWNLCRILSRRLSEALAIP